MSKSGVSRGIEIFGLALAQDAAAERDDPAARVADRDHQPAAEAVVALLAAFLRLDEHAGLDELVFAEMSSARLRALRLSGASPMPKRATVAWSMPRRLRYSRASAPARPCSCSAYHLATSPMTSVRVAVRSAAFVRSRVGGGDVEAGLGRELLDRIHERHAAIVGEEADRVAMRAAAEAMVETLVIVDGEARRLFVVEGAAGLPLASGADQLHRWRDDGRKDRSSAKLVEEGRGKGHSEVDCIAADSRAASARAELSTGMAKLASRR